MIENQSNGLKIWAKMVLTIFLPPLLILFLGQQFLLDLRTEAELKSFEALAADKLEQLNLAANTQRFLAEQLNIIFSSTRKLKDLQVEVEKFGKNLNLKTDYLIWKKNGNVYKSSFKLKDWPGNWKKAFFDLSDFDNKKYGSESKVPVDVYANLRQIFGPHFFPRYFYRCYRGNDLSLLFNDASLNKPLLWLKVAKKFGLAVFFGYEVLERYPGLEKLLAEHDNSQLLIAVTDNGRVTASDPKFAAALQQESEKFKCKFKTIQRMGGYHVVSHFINDELTGLCAIEHETIRKKADSVQIRYLTAVAILLAFLLSLISYRILVRQQSFSLRLKSQLLLLFVFSNVLPGYVIGVVSFDYLQQFRESLLNGAYNRGMSYLHDIDELYENEFTFQKALLEKGLEKLGSSLKTSGINGKAIREYMALQKPQPYRLFLIGSSTAEVATNEAIVRKGKLIDLIDDDFLRGPHKKQQMNALEKIGKFFLSLLNHKPISSKMGTEVEMLTDALSQQEPVELMQEFLQRDGGFWNWGIGSKSHPAYICLLKLFSEEFFDYLFIYLWQDYDLQLNFMLRSFDRFARNENSIRIMAVNDVGNRALPKKMLKHQKLKAFATRLQEKSTRKLDYCTWEGQKYLLVGLKCNQLTHFRLLGLLPLNDIESQIAEKTNLLLGLGLISLLITLSLGMFVAGSVLEPLRELQKGISALNERQFSYRLPNLGNDEFGHLAQIFNNTLVDLEEMHTASIFKDKILRRYDESVFFEKFEIFAQTIAFADAGGDYLEILPGENGLPDRVVLGDVAGSGIAAILILAFVKSALLHLEDSKGHPEILVNELEQLLKVSGRKGQRRFMALQYLQFNSEDSVIDMVNAGMFFPVLLDCRSKEMRQIEMPSAPLGAGSLSLRKVHSIRLESHQALILFSNGIVAGGRIEYQEIFARLADADLSSAQNIFNGFISEFKEKFAPLLNDDVTMVVIKARNERDTDAIA